MANITNNHSLSGRLLALLDIFEVDLLTELLQFIRIEVRTSFESCLITLLPR